MKFTTKNDNRITFKDVSVGQIFSVNGVLYLKVPMSYNKTKGYDFNIIALDQKASFFGFFPDEQVVHEAYEEMTLR